MCDLPFLIANTNYGDVTAVQFAAVVFIIFLLMSGLLVGINLKEKLAPKPKPEKEEQEVKVTPNPLHVKKAETVATKDDIDDLKEEIDKLWAETRDQRKVSRVSLGKIHARIDDLSKQSDTMNGSMKAQFEALKSILDKLLERSLKS